MAHYFIAIFALVFLGAAPLPKSGNSEFDREKLQGKWKLLSVEVNGKLFSPEDVGEWVYITKTGEIVVCKSKKFGDCFRYLCGIAIEKSLSFSGRKCAGEWPAGGPSMPPDDQEYVLDVTKRPKTITFKFEEECEADDEFTAVPNPHYIYAVSKDELKLCFALGSFPCEFDTKKTRRMVS